MAREIGPSSNPRLQKRATASMSDLPNPLSSLGAFPPASDSLLSQRGLQHRVEAKFLMRVDGLAKVLSAVKEHCAILLAGGEPVAEYRTLYLDTEERLCLKEHHRGRRPRYKVRIRHYPDRERSFLEVKRKTSADATVKARRSLAYGQETLCTEDRSFVDANSPIPSSALVPSLRTDFRRITLLSLHTMERTTFDLDLRMSSECENAAFPGLVIAENKQDRRRPRTPMMLALRSIAAPVSVSKYCSAGALLLPSLRMGLYRPKLRTMRRLCSA
jgi:hypothetical protein